MAGTQVERSVTESTLSMISFWILMVLNQPSMIELEIGFVPGGHWKRADERGGGYE